MSQPDNALEDGQALVLRLIQRYELGSMRLGDLADELAHLAPAYHRARGGLDDPFSLLLTAATTQVARLASSGPVGLDDWENALREFRHSIW